MSTWAIALISTMALYATAAMAQDNTLEGLLPVTIGEYTVEDYYSEDGRPLYGSVVFSGLPTLRQGAAYTSETGGEVIVGLIMVNEEYARLVGLDDEQAALQLIHFSDADLLPYDSWFEASVEENMDELKMGRGIVAKPLGGHAALVVETYSPETTPMDDLRSILRSLDVDGLAAHARANSALHSTIWSFLQAFPSALGGHALAGFHIESAGTREPIIAVNAMYGDTEEPRVVLVTMAGGPGMTDVAEMNPFPPSASLTETSVGGRPARDGVVDGMGGIVVTDETAWLALIHLTEESSPDKRLALIDGMDLDPFFHAAAAYRGSDQAVPSSTEPGVGSSEMRLVSWAHVVDADLVRAIIEIDDERIVFEAGHPQLDDFSMMDILLSHQEEHPFLRRIVTIETRGETVVIETRAASLEEAIAPR